MLYAFETYTLDTDRYELRRAGILCSLEPHALDFLAYLLAHRDRVVTKQELLEHLWPQRWVSAGILTQRVMMIRKALGDSGQSQHCIKTIHGRGYRWVADVEVADGATGGERVTAIATPDPRRLEQRIRFCEASDGVRLAYATVGQGPPLVRAAHWMTHLDYEWDSPVWRHWMEGLSRGRTFIRYDERGCGLSDQDPRDISFEAFVRDLETVVDDLGLERFPLLGLSQGGPVAVEYAVRHPERVSRLILIGAFVIGRVARATTPEQRREAEMQAELIQMGWGRADPSFRLYFSSTFMPDADPQLWSDFAALMRRTTSAENALRLNNVSVNMDVREAATKVRVPTLILHGRNEVRIPFSQGREYATRIRGSRLVPLDTRNHLMQRDEPAWAQALREIDAFLAEDESTNRPAEVHI